MMFSLSCSNNDEKSQNNVPQELIGKWKIVEVYSTDGGSPASWSPYDSEEVYDIWIKENNTYISEDNDENCKNGRFSLDNDQITFHPCASEYPFTIEILTIDTLILRDNYIPDILKTKYSKIFE